MRCKKILNDRQRCKRMSNAEYCWQHKSQSGGANWQTFKKQLPKNNHWTVYGHTYCQYALKAIDELKNRNIDPILIKTDNILPKVIHFLKNKNLLNTIPDHRTSPVIFDGLTLVGGYDNLLPYLNIYE
jgi:glutaredoxin